MVVVLDNRRNLQTSQMIGQRASSRRGTEMQNSIPAVPADLLPAVLATPVVVPGDLFTVLWAYPEGQFDANAGCEWNTKQQQQQQQPPPPIIAMPSSTQKKADVGAEGQVEMASPNRDGAGSPMSEMDGTVRCTESSVASYDSSDDSCRLQIAWDGEQSATPSPRSDIGSTGSSGSAKYRKTSPGYRAGAKGARKVLVMGDVPLVYHQNMARKFPGSESRTVEQQRQRQRNTEAARYSRAKTKLMEQLLGKQSRETTLENTNSKRTVASQLVYANLLNKLLGKAPIDLNTYWQTQIQQGKEGEP